MQQIYDEVRSIAASNDNDKNHANKHCRFIEFSEGIMVIICIHPEWLPLGANEMLHTRNVSPFKVLKKLSSNGYALDFPLDFALVQTSMLQNSHCTMGGHDNDEDSEE